MTKTPAAVALCMTIAAAAAAAQEDVTYCRHIAPILYKQCAGCHRPGEIGPFPLLTYKDAAKRAKFLKDVTASHRMPPWKAEPQEHKFLDERRLSDAEVALLAKWADTGAKEGDPKDLPAAPKFADGWQLGTPDLVVKMRKPFKVYASGRDIYQWFALPIGQEADRTVAAVEFRPGNAKVVHHALMYLDSSGKAKGKDRDGEGWHGAGGPGFAPSGGLGVWVPGLMPRFLPGSLGMLLPKGSDLVLQIHYHPTGREETDQSSVGIYFTKKPAEHLVAGITAANFLLRIPAGAKSHRVEAATPPLAADAQATGIFPHMHLLGRQMKAVAHLPGGGTIPLLDVRDWDFNWQNVYLFEKPVALPKGTVVKIETVYDNSADNPNNPSSPPKAVHWGEQTTDEMCLLAVQVTTANGADLRKVVRMKGNHLGAALVGGVVDTALLSDATMTPEKVVPAEGFPIPEKYKALVGFYDTNKDGRLSADEIAKMPKALRDRTLDYIERETSK